MKILHCCLAAFYIDNYGYQENVFPKMHKLQGHNVQILASTETYVQNKHLGFTNSNKYLNENGIPVTRIPYLKSLPQKIASKLRIYNGIGKVLKEFNPDIIFIHDCQFIGIKEIAKFVKNRPNVKIYVDSHTDFINSGKNWLSRHILHGFIYKWCAKKIEPYTTKFYGTLPLRVEFYKEIYGINESKLDLLVLGADLTDVNLEKRNYIRAKVRKELNIKETHFVIITGGKIDKRKKIDNLLRVISNLNDRDIHLICFGSPNDEMNETFEMLIKSPRVHSLGWLKPDQVNDYFFAADLAVFPGTHSILWEQAIGLGVPCIFKRWRGIEHVDIGGNCLFLESDSEEELKVLIQKVKSDEYLFTTMKKVSIDKGTKEFSYFEIAKKAIGN